jgi:hypothetical protein
LADVVETVSEPVGMQYLARRQALHKTAVHGNARSRIRNSQHDIGPQNSM